MNILSRNTIKVSVLLLTCYLSTVTAFAQPSWTKNASKSVFTLKTFSADGSLIASTNGFFTGTNGEAVSSFYPFKGASRAIIIDSSGKEWQVKSMLGANEMYDITKFRVNNPKTQPLPVCKTTMPVGSNTWLLPYHEVKNIKNGVVRKAESINGEYAYYTVAMKMTDNQVSCPLLNETGEVIGLMQQPASENDTLSYAISARFADSLRITGLTFNDATLKQTMIQKELPADIQDATVALYMASTAVDSAEYVSLIEAFIQQFPSAPDGYIYRAQQEVANGDYSSAERDMNKALSCSNQPDDTHYTYARMIYNKEVFQSEHPYEGWSLDKALTEARAAIAEKSMPAYRQLEADILYAQKKYDEAYTIYIDLTKTNLQSAELYFSAARCKEMLKDTTAMLALLDSTMNTFSKPYLKEAAPYLWSRAQARRDAGKYRDAITDMNEYENLMRADINDTFYYIRHQTDVQGRLYQQGLNDIRKAIDMNPTETLYYAEKASLEIRVGLYDEAILTANECIKIEPDNSDGYLFLGLAQCLKGEKSEGLKNLQKAKDMGDSQAEGLIKKYATDK